MNNINALWAPVVDRGGLPFVNRTNDLAMANRPSCSTAGCRVPVRLANLFTQGIEAGTGETQSGEDDD